MKTSVSAFVARATAIPHNTKRRAASPYRHDSVNTAAAAASPPSSANGPSQTAPRPLLITTVAANPAPWLTPMTSGLARGFLLIACSNAPDSPSRVPTASATTIRGSRRSWTTTVKGPSPASARTTSPGATKVLPTPSESSTASAVRARSSRNTPAARRRSTNVTGPTPTTLRPSTG
jgi:hypothetical protein